MILLTAFHKVSFHQTRYLECFADSSGIPWNLPTIFRPNLIATAPHMSLALILRIALSPIPLISDLCGVDEEWFQGRSSQMRPEEWTFSRRIVRNQIDHTVTSRCR